MSGEARVRKARDVIVAAWEVSRDPLADAASEAAQALDDAGLLQSPETAAELERLRQMELGVYVVISRLATIVSAPAPEGLEVYEARYDGTALGAPYSKLGAAQEHCETHARRMHSRSRVVWAGGELLMRDDDGALVSTGHTVETVKVASHYDERGPR
ncbi:hypothetical protein [Streptomyces sp. XH2]|uniref:hypothetical protein n=1 Tax=Streptomyces sp. XH2 TaxID=3412483 RepID=UPI003C7DA961